MTDLAPETTETTPAPADDASAPIEAAAQAETPADVPPEEGEKKSAADASKLLAALTRKKARLRAEQAAVAQEREHIRRQAEQAAAQARETEQIRQALARAREGDLDALEQLGVRYDDLTTVALRRGTPEAKIDTLAKQLEAERKAREESEARAREREQSAAAEQAIRAFVGLVQGGEYPESSLYPADRLAAWGNQLADEMAEARGGRYPGMKEIAAELEKRVAAEHARIRGAQQKSAEEAARKARPPSPTLSNRDSADRATGRRLSDEERDRLFAEWVSQNMGAR